MPEGIEAIDQHIEELREERVVFIHRGIRARNEAQRLFSQDKLAYRQKQGEVIAYKERIINIEERLKLLKKKRAGLFYDQ